MQCVKLNLVLFYILFYSAISSEAILDTSTSITIYLNKSYKYENREIYGEFINIQNYSTIKVNFTELPLDTNLTFLVFQAHSFINNITLYQNEKVYGSEVTGTNIGMVSVIKGDPNSTPNITDEYYVENINDINMKVYISVHVYVVSDPYPGGCNIANSVDIPPYLIVNTEQDFINVDAAAASVDPNCTILYDDLVRYYMMYLPESSFGENEYFIGLKRMMTLENVRNYGSLLPRTSSLTKMARTLSAYPSTGVIIVALAEFTIDNVTGYSVYVPNHSYGCRNLDEDGCSMANDMFSQVLCLCLVTIGLFVTIFGHRFFKTEMFLSGFCSGFIITYILISIMEVTSIDTAALLAASILSGCFFGAIWLLFWWLYGIPVLAVLLPALNLGFLLASIFYYRMPAMVVYLGADLNFWSLFNLIMLLTALALVSTTYSASILCCAVLGAFATVYGLDYSFGSNLKYIVINTIRRAVVPKFQSAVIAPPFMWKEIVMTLLWITLACLGWVYQLWYNRGRPPFPPPPRSTRMAVPESTSAYGSINPTRTQTQRGPRSLYNRFRASLPFRVASQRNSDRTPLNPNA